MVHAQTVYTVESLPNPKDISGLNYISDPDKILSSGEKDQINGLILELENTTTAQVGVAIMYSIGDEVPKEFATALFRHWGIGQKENNNGLLILLVLDQRRMEFETGYGLEPILTDGICKRIQVEKMVPKAKEEAYGQAIIAGMEEVNRILMNPKYRDEIYANTDADGNDLSPFWRKPMPLAGALAIGIPYLLSLFVSWKNEKKNIKKAPAYVQENYNPFQANVRRLALGLGAPGAIIASEISTGILRTGEFILIVYALFVVLLVAKRLRLNRWVHQFTQDKEAYDVHQLLEKSHGNGWGLSAFAFPLPFGLYWIWHAVNLRKLRNTAPLNSAGLPMEKLSEEDDDAFLKGYQQTEEKIRSVDYDVWADAISGDKKIYRYDLHKGAYTICKNCGGKTRHHSSTRTISAATYTSSGTGEKTFTCKHCGNKDTATFTIPKKVQSSSSGSGGSGGGGGGGFGGGSSGGGGAGSSW
jgi:uncharacterized protein